MSESPLGRDSRAQVTACLDTAAVSWAHRLHLGVGTKRSSTPHPALAQWPRCRVIENKQLLKRLIFTLQTGAGTGSFLQLATGLPRGMDAQEALGERGRCPHGHQHPGRDNVFRRETACSEGPSGTSELCLHTFGAEGQPPPTACWAAL